MCFEPLGLRATLEREAAEPEFCVRGESKQTPEKTVQASERSDWSEWFAGTDCAGWISAE